MTTLFDEKTESKVAKIIKELYGKMYNGFKLEVRRKPRLYIQITFLDERSFGFASFTLTEQVNCCGILISTDTWVTKEYLGQGVAQEMMNLKLAIAKEFGYSAMIATVDVKNNPAEVHILEKYGWKKTFEFINDRTKHTLGIFCKDLHDE